MANCEYLLSDKNVDDKINEYEKILKAIEGQNILSPTQLADKVCEIARDGDIQRGESLPFDCDDLFKLRLNELSIWAGINGHGKSQILLQVMLWTARNAKVLIVSLELRPEQTLYRMGCMYAGCRLSEGYARRIFESFNNRIYIYSLTGNMSPNRLKALIYYANEELGVSHIVIDSMMKVGLDADDYNAEKRFIDDLQNVVKLLPVHLHVVVHARKASDESKRPNKFDVIGTGHITNLADNVLIFWRNKLREMAAKKIQKGVALSDKEQREIELGYDAILAVEKNRHYGEEGIIGLYFHKQSGQFGRREGQCMLPPFELNKTPLLKV